MTALYVVGGIVLLFVLLLLMPVTLSVSYDDEFSYKLKYAFVTVLPSKKENKQQATDTDKADKSKNKSKNKISEKLGFISELFKNNDLPYAISELLSLISSVFNRFDDLLCRTSVSRLNLDMKLHKPDAAAAAIFYGEVCAVLYPLLGFINSKVPIRHKKISVLCDYDGPKTDCKLYLKWRLIPIFCIKPLVLLILDIIKMKSKKGE